MNNHFSQKLKAFREFSGLSQEALAQKLGVSFTTVNRWENGRSEPNPLARKSIEMLWKEYGFITEVAEDTKRLRVLIVDDEEDIILLLRRALDGCAVPLEIESATDGYEAGYKVKSFQPHVVLLDVFLPGVRGDKICARIKNDSELKDTYVIAISGYLNSALEKSMRESGADEILAKPFNIALIKELIEDYFKNQFGSSESP